MNGRRPEGEEGATDSVRGVLCVRILLLGLCGSEADDRGSLVLVAGLVTFVGLLRPQLASCAGRVPIPLLRKVWGRGGRGRVHHCRDQRRDELPAWRDAVFSHLHG